MAREFYQAIEERRSYYGISKETVVSDERIKEVINHAVKYTPSAFNSQSTRVVLLLDKEHHKFWNYVRESLRKIVPAEQFADTDGKITSFENGYGTVLFFDDNSIVEQLQANFPLYADNFPVWAQQSNGMQQFVIWTALETEGFGASLQHYAEVVNEDVRKEWNIPENWKFIAQMPFGKPIAEPSDKEFAPVDERFLVFA